MRLLQITDGVLSLVERIGNEIPPYAILSHTWGIDEYELTFRDMRRGTGREKPGWRKIEFCVQQAVKDGLDYFWIDTCCIDKSSSSELTEAINSMFRWYQNAAKCYVFLSDILFDEIEGRGTSSESQALEHNLRKSRWFTRGWTLQELLAPPAVEFFTSEGKSLGTKSSLDETLAQVTGIDIEALCGKPLTSFSVQERLTWASARQTKREEDGAYALMGILGVSMPIIYGEGRHHAKTRLLEAVLSVKLPFAEGASFDSHSQEHWARCLPHTRTALLEHLKVWAGHRNSKPIFWLKGMAGTGKSTIARTIAEHFAKQHQLGGSFFFKTGEADRNSAKRLFTTIAVKLMDILPDIIPSIRDAIQEDPAVFERSLRVQFEKLILQPLAQLPSSSSREIVVVIDALDECVSDHDVLEVLRLLPLVNELEFIVLRVFLTSRPELPIRLGFRNMSGAAYDNFILHEIPADVVKHDIGMFIWHELGLVREQRSLPPDWPTNEQVRLLTNLATPLFIFAATACRYIGDPRHNPQRRLQLILDHAVTKVSKLDATYLPIMMLLYEEEDEDDKEYWAAEFRTIVGSIILVFDPLSINSISKLTGVSRFDVGCRLDALHSVLNVPDSDDLPVRLLHLSFRDFLLDPRRQGKSVLWIEEKKTHETLMRRCFDLMSSETGLRKDICDLRLPDASRGLIDGERFAMSLPPELQYACRFWFDHMVQSGTTIKEGDSLHVFFQKQFVHWLEAMYLMGSFSSTVSITKDLYDLISTISSHRSTMLTVIRDAMHFAANSHELAVPAVLQLYSSALIFTPTSNTVRKAFGHTITPGIERLSWLEGDHDGLCHHHYPQSRPIKRVYFSHDGSMVASTSADHTLQLWDVERGVQRGMLVRHSSWISAVQFSQDNQLIASSSYDKCVQIWSTRTDTCLHTLEAHTDWVTTIVFSRSGRLLASASRDGTVRMWYMDTGLCYATLIGHERTLVCIAFSRNDDLVASGAEGGDVRLWDVETGDCRATLKGHAMGISCVAFSEDGLLLASTSSDLSVRVWHTQTGACLYELEGHTAWVHTATFSPDGQSLASAASDQTLRMWDLSQGNCRSVLAVHGSGPWYTKPITFSSDGRYLETDLGWFPVSSDGRLIEGAESTTVFAASGWLYHNSRRILRLPTRQEPTCTARYGNILCLGHESGLLTLLRYNTLKDR